MNSFLEKSSTRAKILIARNSYLHENNQTKQLTINEALDRIQKADCSDFLKNHFTGLIMDLCDEHKMETQDSYNGLMTSEFRNIMTRCFAETVEINNCPAMSYKMANREAISQYAGEMSMPVGENQVVCLSDFVGVEPIRGVLKMHGLNNEAMQDFTQDVRAFVGKSVSVDGMEK